MARKKRRRKQTRTPSAPPASCAVKRCDLLALERHTGPAGVVWLCGRCGMSARLKLRAEVIGEEIADAIAAPFKRLALFREEQRRRIYS